MNRAKIGKLLLRGAAVFGLVIVVALVATRCVYGGGEHYDDVTSAPVVAGGDVERVVTLDYPLGNVTSSADGRIFFNIHPFVQAHRFTDAFFFELVDGEPRPFPNADMQEDLMFVFGMTVDDQQRLWLTSPATLDRSRTRIQAFDLETQERVFDHELDEGVGRFAQDIRVTADGRTMVLADTGAFRFTSGSLLILDLETREVRTVLEGHPSTQPQDWMIRTTAGDDYTIGYGLLTFSVGVDGIAFSPDDAFLYFATMSHDTLYRVATEHLFDASLSDEELASHLEVIGDKPLSDGIETTASGEVIVTDVEHGAVVGIEPDGTLRTLIRLDEIVWSDGVNVMHDGSVLLTDSSIPSYIDPLLRPPELERIRAGAPYHIYRFRPSSDGD